MTADGARPGARLVGMLAAGLLVFAAAGCGLAEREFGVTVKGLEVQSAAGRRTLLVRQEVVLSSEARDALENGVPLVILVEGRLRPEGANRDRVRLNRSFEIRYLPLSSHFQLIGRDGGRDGASMRTYPRLRHALAGLGEVRFELPDGLLASGRWEARVRSRLQTRALPPPMRLPAWFSSRWKHDSGWLTQVVSIGGAA